MLDTLIENARIIDGSGAPSRQGRIGIRRGKLVLHPGPEPAARTIDAAGLCLAPGFIDAHSHGDMLLGTEDAGWFKATQGVTTEAAGQCGSSMAPVRPEHLRDLRNLVGEGVSRFSDGMAGWTTYERYLSAMEAVPKKVNSLLSVGHGSLRIAAMGMADRAPTASELDAMKGMLREAMQAGAAGLSTGLIYTPSGYADTRELIELAKVIAPYGGLYATHLRSESTGVTEAVQEAIRIGREAGVRVDISHHKMLGRRCRGQQKETLRLMREARAAGVSVFCDQYPYTCSSTTLNTCLPPRYFDGGFDSLADRLSDPAFRAEARAVMEDPAAPYSNHYIDAGGWDGITVTSAPATPDAEGKTILQFAEETGRDPFDAYFGLMAANRCVTAALFHCMCMEDICEIYQDPFCVVGSDGITRGRHAKGHPRACGTFPRTIRLFVREKKLVTLEEAVHKMTGLTVSLLQIENKGLLREGYDADLVLFDPDRISDTATYADPNLPAAGIRCVLVGGETVCENGALTDRDPGRILRRRGEGIV